jgi:hypothetical protein
VAPDALAVAAYRMHTDRGLGDTVYRLFVGGTRLLVWGFGRTVQKWEGADFEETLKGIVTCAEVLPPAVARRLAVIPVYS